MIPGRFHENFSYFFPRSVIAFKLARKIERLFYPVKQFLFGKYLFSDFRVHLHDLFIRTRDLDPFDDSKNRYAVIQYRFDEKQKKIVQIRTGASTTLKGAKRKVKNQSEITGLEYLWYHKINFEYISIHYFRINFDIDQAIKRRHFKSKYDR